MFGCGAREDTMSSTGMQCPLCQKPAEGRTFVYGDRDAETPSHEITCVHCGKYSIAVIARRDLEAEKFRDSHLLAGFLREQRELGDDWVHFNRENIRQVKLLAPKGVQEKVGRLLRAIAVRSEYPGFEVDLSADDSHFLAYCTGRAEFQFYLKHLEAQELLDLDETMESTGARLTVEGWRELDRQRRANTTSTKVFVAMAF